MPDVQLVLPTALGVLVLMGDSVRAGAVHLHFAGEKLQSPLRFSGPRLWSNLDHQRLAKNKILVGVETPGAERLDHLLWGMLVKRNCFEKISLDIFAVHEKGQE